MLIDFVTGKVIEIHNDDEIDEVEEYSSSSRFQCISRFLPYIEFLDGLVTLIEKKYEMYKEFADKSPAEELRGRLTYGFEGIFLQADLYRGDGKELLMNSFMMV